MNFSSKLYISTLKKDGLLVLVIIVICSMPKVMAAAQRELSLVPSQWVEWEKQFNVQWQLKAWDKEQSFISLLSSSSQCPSYWEATSSQCQCGKSGRAAAGFITQWPVRSLRAHVIASGASSGAVLFVELSSVSELVSEERKAASRLVSRLKTAICGRPVLASEYLITLDHQLVSFRITIKHPTTDQT